MGGCKGGGDSADAHRIRRNDIRPNEEERRGRRRTRTLYEALALIGALIAARENDESDGDVRAASEQGARG